MALIKSTILAQISGSINGMTFSHNSGGAYARNRSIPANPGTDRQDEVRTAMAAISDAWKTVLTENQRTLWRSYGQGLQVQNRLGDTISLSGIAAFNRVNLFRMSTLNTSMEMDPPAPPTRSDPPPTFNTVNVGWPISGAPQLEIMLTNVVGSEYSIAVYYSGAISPGIKYYRGPYVNHTTEAVTTASTLIDMPEFGTTGAAVGQQVASKVTLYDTSSGLPIWTINADPVILPTQS